MHRKSWKRSAPSSVLNIVESQFWWHFVSLQGKGNTASKEVQAPFPFFFFVFCPLFYFMLLFFQILAVSCNLISVLDRWLAHFSLYLRPSPSNWWKIVASVYMTAFTCLSRLWHLFGLDHHCKSHCMHSHLGESEGQDRLFITSSWSLFCHVVHGGKVAAWRMRWKKWYEDGELAVLAGHSISGFLLSELNFSAVAVCLLFYLKDLHVSSCNSCFKMDLFILLSLLSLVVVSWELLLLSSKGWEHSLYYCLGLCATFALQ